MVAAAHSQPALGWAWILGAVGVGAVVALNLAVLPPILAGGGPGDPPPALSAAPVASGDARVARQGQRDTLVPVVEEALTQAAHQVDVEAADATSPRAEDRVAERPVAEVVVSAGLAATGGAPAAAKADVPDAASTAPGEGQADAEPADEPGEVVLRFAMDAFAVEPRHEAALAPILARLRREAGCGVEVDCHADRFGDARFNETLTSRRCRSVAAHIEASGVGGGRVKTRAHGERKTPGRDGELDPSARVARVVLVCGAETPAGVHGDPEE